MRFRVVNLSKNVMNLSVFLQERAENASDLIIQSIENESLGRLESQESREIVLKLFARRLGTLPLTGLHIKDALSEQQLNKRSICSISVR